VTARGAVLAGVADVVAGIRAATSQRRQAARDYAAAVSAEGEALIALVRAAAEVDRAGAGDLDALARAGAVLADAREVLAGVLRRRDDAAARLGVAAPDALAVQLLDLLATGRVEFGPTCPHDGEGGR
jgi:hypothetical protein